jgi:hypothetical protein
VQVGVVFVRDFLAAQTFVAAIGGDAGGFDRMQAVESFRQSAGERFKFIQLLAGEQIRVTEPPARERTLQKLDALGLVGNIFEGHEFRLVGAGKKVRRDTMNPRNFASLPSYRQDGVPHANYRT